MRWPVPHHWEWKPAGEIAEVIGGGTPRTSIHGNFAERGIPWITPADLSGYRGTYIDRGDRDLSEAGLSGSGARMMPAGSVLYSSRAPIGYCVIARNPVSTNQGFKSLVLRDGLAPEFVRYYLLSSREFIEGMASGTTFKEISGKRMSEVPIPIPPPDEQRQIVEAIETHFSLLDACVRSLTQAKRNVERARASVLKAAVEGRLVPTEAELARNQGREYEHASDLLHRILAEREARHDEEQKDAKRKKKYKAPVAPDTGDLPEPPEGWVWATVDQLTTMVTSGSRGWARYYADTGAAFVRIGDLSRGTLSVDFPGAQRVRPPKGAEGVRTRLAARDILISITADLGVIGIVPELFPEAYINQHVAIARPVDRETAPFIAWYLDAPHAGQVELGERRRGATKVGLGLDDIRETRVPLPPLTEQDKIVEEIERRFSILDAVEASIDANLKRCERLRQSILKWAFEGKLVQPEAATEPIHTEAGA